MVAAQPDADLIRRIIEKERAAILAEVDRRYGTVDRSDVVNVPLLVGSKGTALVAGQECFFELGLSTKLEIVSWGLIGDPSGSVTVDVKVGATSTAVASICGTHFPALASATDLLDQPPAADWTTTIADKQVIKMVVTGTPSGAEVLSLTLRCRKR